MNWRSIILDKHSLPSKDLLELLKVTDLHHDGTLHSIVTATQKAWLRPAFKERWEMKELYADKADTLIPILHQMNFAAGSTPHNKIYEYAVVFGGIVERAQKRIEYLVNQWDAGIRFNNIIILGAQRHLDPFKEKDHLALATETGMLEWLVQHISMPPALKKNITIIDTPEQKTVGGLPRRPNTTDTVKTWLATSPSPNTVCAISTHSFAGYHDVVLRSLLPHGFTIETVAPAAHQLNISECLDNLARWLYVEHKMSIGSYLK